MKRNRSAGFTRVLGRPALSLQVHSQVCACAVAGAGLTAPLPPLHDALREWRCGLIAALAASFLKNFLRGVIGES